MKKILFAVLLCTATLGVASAATQVPASDGYEGGDPTPPFGVPIYVRGGFNDWGLANGMTYDSGAMTYSASISLGVGSYEFKIASEDWATIDLGNAGGVGPITDFPASVDVGRTAFGNFAIEIAAAGDYIFTLDVSNYTGPDGPYKLTIEQAVVPLPAAAWLFISALGGLGFLRRR